MPLFFPTFTRLLCLSGFFLPRPSAKPNPRACLRPTRLLPKACSSLWWDTFDRKSPHAATPRVVDIEPATNSRSAAARAPMPSRSSARSTCRRTTSPHTPTTIGPSRSSPGNTRTIVA